MREKGKFFWLIFEEIVFIDFIDVDVYICCDNVGKFMRIL